MLPLEHYVLAKPYFDREGLIIAEDAGEPVGFAHAGFGPDESGQRLSYDTGVVCLVAVRPSHRRRKVGTELLRRAEAYLRGQGAKTIYAGGMRPLNPFYWGLYGGSELPGLLRSDAAAEPFLLANGYAVWDRCIVLNRRAEGAPAVADARFAVLRRQYEVAVMSRPVAARWYEECLLSPFEMLQFQLRPVDGGAPVAEARVWDMEMFGWRWHEPTAGIIDVAVAPEHRGQGIGKFFVLQILLYLQDQFFTLTEVQTMERNTAALGLYRALGFYQVDEGRVYRLRETG